jgi:predicted secreted acid phosphatase
VGFKGGAIMDYNNMSTNDLLREYQKRFGNTFIIFTRKMLINALTKSDNKKISITVI